MSAIATPRRAPLAEKPANWMSLPMLNFDVKSPTPKSASTKVARTQSLVIPTQRQSLPKRSREDEKEVATTSRVKRTRVLSTTLGTAASIATVSANIHSKTTTTNTAPVSTVHPSQTVLSHSVAAKEKEAKRSHRHTRAERLEREREIQQFKSKFTRAFPSFTFYFHSLDSNLKKTLAAKVIQQGSRVEDFFSASVTHVISNRPRPPAGYVEKFPSNNKENQPQSKTSQVTRPPAAQLRSPINLRGAKAPAVPEAQPYDPVILKAIQFNMKIWESGKLESIIGRLRSDSPTDSGPSPKQDLSHLLAVERLQGLTNERDPNTRRPDWEYFPKSTYYLMVQDMQDSHPPVAIKDFGRWKKGDRPGWPILNIDGVCGASGKTPAVFGWRPEMDQADKPPRTWKCLVADSSKKQSNLRRTMSMHNLGRDRLKAHEPRGDHQDDYGFVDASRPSIPSQAYMAASGNSTNVTSTVASTTSTAPFPTQLVHQNPNALTKLRQHVLTRTTFSKTRKTDEEVETQSASILVPRPHLLKKSKSTNTLRLPPREETKKPGYCENCRYKFDDFSKHVKSKRHTKFADNQNHFQSLDLVLSRLERKTLREHEREVSIADYILDDISDDEDDDQDQDEVTAHDDSDEWRFPSDDMRRSTSIDIDSEMGIDDS